MSTSAPTNPLKSLRLSLGLTLEDVASGAEISRMAVIRNEQGCYTSPSPSLLAFYELHSSIDSSFIDSYRTFQYETRRANYGKLDPTVLQSIIRVDSTINPRVGVRVRTNPISEWRLRSGLSKARVSTLYCIHPDIVSRIECRPHLVPVSLPKQFIDALFTSGYDKDDLARLNTVFLEYREAANKVANGAAFVKAG